MMQDLTALLASELTEGTSEKGEGDSGPVSAVLCGVSLSVRWRQFDMLVELIWALVDCEFQKRPWYLSLREHAM